MSVVHSDWLLSPSLQFQTPAIRQVTNAVLYSEAAKILAAPQQLGTGVLQAQAV